MPRSRKRAAKKRTANFSSGIKSRRVLHQSDQSSHGETLISQPSVAQPLNPSHFGTDGSAADRYNDMAESLNVQGAMEMAVPFYRQAIALLLAERENLREQLGYEAPKSVGADLPLEELHGLMNSAGASDRGNSRDDIPSVEDQIHELASELNQANALQVMAGLRAIAEDSEKPIPATGLALLAKAQMLLGKTDDGLKSFEAALVADPDSVDFKINTGAARLVEGDLVGALSLLRGIYNSGIETLDPKSLSAVLRNLSAAEARADNLPEAMRLRLEWFQAAPQSVSVDRWLSWVKNGLAATSQQDTVRPLAMELLKNLQEQHPQDRKLMECLAEALEEQGNYREASLLYRNLLRPQ